MKESSRSGRVNEVPRAIPHGSFGRDWKFREVLEIHPLEINFGYSQIRPLFPVVRDRVKCLKNDLAELSRQIGFHLLAIPLIPAAEVVNVFAEPAPQPFALP